MDWLLRRLADRLGVEPARRRRGDHAAHPLRAALAAGGHAAGRARLRRPDHLALPPRGAGLARVQDRAWRRSRITLVLLAVFMLSEAVLSVERTGLPYFVVMVDDSASAAGRRPVRRPRRPRPRPPSWPRVAGQPEPSRLAVAQGWLAQDDGKILRELQKQNKVRLYLVSTSARLLAEIDKPEDVAPALEKLQKVEADRRPDPAGRRGPRRS